MLTAAAAVLVLAVTIGPAAVIAHTNARLVQFIDGLNRQTRKTDQP